MLFIEVLSLFVGAISIFWSIVLLKKYNEPRLIVATILSFALWVHQLVRVVYPKSPLVLLSKGWSNDFFGLLLFCFLCGFLYVISVVLEDSNRPQLSTLEIKKRPLLDPEDTDPTGENARKKTYHEKEVHWRLQAQKREKENQELEEEISRLQTEVEALRESDLRDVMEAFQKAPCDMWLCDDEGRFVLQNTHSLSFWGDMCGKHLDELELSPKLVALWKDNFLKALHGDTVQNEYELGHATGKMRVLQVLMPYKSTREVKGLLGVHLPVPRQKQQEQSIEDQREKLRQANKMESLSQLAGGVAHEFNNILATIRGNAELIRYESGPYLPDTHSVNSDLDSIEGSIERGSFLTRQLLTFSQRYSFNGELISPSEILKESEMTLRKLMYDNIWIKVRRDPNLWAFYADKGHMIQVILNLAINAREAMPDGGTLDLRAENVYLDEAYVRDYPEASLGAHIMFTISDTGVGIDDETMNRIFEPFFTTKPTGEGTGLGLAMVHGIVRQAKGHIVVDSELGRGTTFRISIPADRSATVPKKPESKAPLSLAGNETILVCEDADGFLQLIRRILESQGYRVLAAHRGESAIQLATNFHGAIHLLITDVSMPEMSGQELAKVLTPMYKDLEVLYISGFTPDILEPPQHASEPVHFLQKPFHSKKLLEKIREIFDN